MKICCSFLVPMILVINQHCVHLGNSVHYVPMALLEGDVNGSAIQQQTWDTWTPLSISADTDTHASNDIFYFNCTMHWKGLLLMQYIFLNKTNHWKIVLGVPGVLCLQTVSNMEATHMTQYVWVHLVSARYKSRKKTEVNPRLNW